MKYNYIKKILLIFLAAINLASCLPLRIGKDDKCPLIRVSFQGGIIDVPLEKYVASVLAGEVERSWPMDSLMAQAISARTFALRKMKERKDRPFDVTSSTMDQVYNPTTLPTFVAAAKATSGLVLTFNKNLAETSFHSTCGGNTTSAKSVWGTDHAHLQGVKCGFCKKSPTFSWTSNFKLSELEEKLKQKVSGLKIKEKWADGRAKLIEIFGGKKERTMKSHEFRMLVDPMRLKSTKIASIKLDGDAVKISGNGFGHGVGMCQYGAKGMADSGYNYKAILAYYYPNTEIKKIY